jgi:pentapeptide MXKDX repeat protein
MRKLISIGMCAGMLLLSSQAFSQDTPSQDTSTKPATGASTDAMSSHHQMMKDCMTDQQAKNSAMSKDDMTKACRAQVKMKEQQMKSSGTDKDNTSK